MRFLSVLKKEIFHVLPVFCYFLLFFMVISWIEGLLFEKVGLTPFRFTEVVIAAALIAKIILVVDHLPAISLFDRRPLIYSILWKTGFYWVILFMVRVLIRFVPFLWGEKSHFISDVSHFMQQVDWRLFLSVQIYYLLLLFIFEVFHGLICKIGFKKTCQIFFGK